MIITITCAYLYTCEEILFKSIYISCVNIYIYTTKCHLATVKRKRVNVGTPEGDRATLRRPTPRLQ